MPTRPRAATIRGPIALRQLTLRLVGPVTMNGSAQNVAHGLGAVPALVFASAAGGHNGAGAAGTQLGSVSMGTHTATNLVVTGTAGTVYNFLVAV